MKRQLYLVLLVVTALAACATGGSRLSDAERLALFQDNAGEPVNSFRYFSRLHGWTPLGNSALAVWPRSNEAYLLELWAPCQGLNFAHAITLTSRMNVVTARVDSVIPNRPGTSPTGVSCRIHTIRPLNLDELQTAMQELREASAVEREGDDAPVEGEGGSQD